MTPPGSATALVLAAGKGTRMKADLAKVLFPLGGKPLILHVVDAAEGAGVGRILVVVGHQRDRVAEVLAGRRVELVVQDPQLGTGHAVQCAGPALEGFRETLLVLAGDAPFIRAGTIHRMIGHHERSSAAVTVLTTLLEDPTGYGRVVREGGRIVRIVEEKDASPEIRAVREINSSIYAFRYPFLAGVLPGLRTENRQKEFYLTDAVHLAAAAGEVVEGVVVQDPHEVSGINTSQQLVEAERLLAERTRG